MIRDTDIHEKLMSFLCSNFLVEKDEIDINKSLVDTGIIDSIGLVEIAAFIKREYGIEVGEEQMTRDNFGSVVKIVTFIIRETPN
ncbi:MAG: acyl carrier protein [Chitinivibrionales bacterium]